MINKDLKDLIESNARQTLITQITQEFMDAIDYNDSEESKLEQVTAYTIFKEHCTDLEERLINNK